MAISRAASQAEAAEAAAKEEALKKRAARQAAAKLDAAAPPADMVSCRVLKAGDGKVSMGTHIAGIGDAFYERNETFRVEREIAVALEDRGYVEIEDAPKADAG